MGRPPIELLAPARDLASGIDAVNCGADAVYAGGPEFGCPRCRVFVFLEGKPDK